MFGSKSGSHQWIIVTVDLKAAFRKFQFVFWKWLFGFSFIYEIRIEK